MNFSKKPKHRRRRLFISVLPNKRRCSFLLIPEIYEDVKCAMGVRKEWLAENGKNKGCLVC